MDATVDPFLKAWEAKETAKSPSPTVPSIQVADPWGTMLDNSEGVTIQGNLEGTTNSAQQPPLSRDVPDVPLNQVFQQCNNFTESAISNKNNSHDGNASRNSGFDDDFGAWSETDVLFKSGLLDEEFKMVSVTAEEDDLWSSADLSPLNLSMQSQQIVSHDVGKRPEEVASDKSEAFQNPDVIIYSEAGDDSGDNNDKDGNVPFSSTPKLSKKVSSLDQVGQTDSKPDLDRNLFGSTEVRSASSSNNGEEDGVNPFDGSIHRVTRSSAEATAGVSKTITTQEFRVTHSSSTPGSTTPTVNTSINSTQCIAVSNSEAFSASPQSRSLHGGSGQDSTASVTKDHSQGRIPSIVVDSSSGPFLIVKTVKTNMGNILDKEKEEQEKMEGEGVVTQDKGEQSLPPETIEVDKETAAPGVDLKETVIVHDEGTEVMVNGDHDHDDQDSMNVSLDNQTQTREDEFPPDVEYQTEPTTGENQSKKEGPVDGEEEEEESTRVLKQKNEQEGNKAEGAAEKEDSSEGYGSQDADKALESEENRMKDHGKENGEKEEKKDPEVTLSQDEGLASPEAAEESKVVSTNDSDHTVGVGLVDSKVEDSNVELVNVDHALEYDEPTGSLLDNIETSAGPHHLEQTLDTLEPCTTHKQISTENVDEQGIVETNILPHNHTNQIAVHNESDKPVTNVLRSEEGPDVDTEEITPGQQLCPKEIIHDSDESIALLANQQIDTDTTGEGSHNDMDVVDVGVYQSNFENQKDIPGSEPDQVHDSKSQEVSDVNLQLPKKDISNMDITHSEDDSLDTPVPSVELKEASPEGTRVDSSQLAEEPLEDQTKNEESLEIVEAEEECRSKVDESKSLDLDEELNQNKFEETSAVAKGNSVGETFDSNKPLEENIVNFVDQVLSNALEEVSTTSRHDGYEQEEEKQEKTVETNEMAIKELLEDGETVDSKVSETSKEAIVDDKETVSVEDDLSQNVDTDKNCNLESNTANKEIDETEANDVFSVQGADDLSRLGDSTSQSEQVENEGKATRGKRLSVPPGQFFGGKFSYTDPQKSESSETGIRKFRSVKFRPSSQLSKDGKFRRTSIGVPRGWNAPPVDLLPPSPESDQGISPETTESSVKLEETGPSSITSDASMSSESSVSLQSFLSNDNPQVQEEANIYKAEPVVQAVVEEHRSSAPPPVEGLTPEINYNTDSLKVETTSSVIIPHTLSPINLASTSQLEAVTEQGPILPVQRNTPKELIRKTPPLSQKVEVYEIKEEPTVSPTGSLERRQHYAHNRSATVGDLSKKVSKSEHERQQVFAALRVKRPVKHKWQGQVELEEKEKGKQVTMDQKSLQSLQKYENRRKEKKQSKSFDLGMSNNVLSEAKPVDVRQDEQNEGSSQNFEVEPNAEPESAGHHRPQSLNIDGHPDEDIPRGGEYLSRDEALSPNGDACSSGYTSGRSTPAGEDASRLLSLPKAGEVPTDSSFYKECQDLVAFGEEEQNLPTNEERGLRPAVLRDSELEDQSSAGQPKSYVKTAVKMREKSGSSRVNSHVVKQNRISFVEQELLRNKQQEEEYRLEREKRSRELIEHGRSSSPSSLSPSSSAGNSRLHSPTSPEPPAMKPVKATSKQTNSQAKAVYQELNYNATIGGNRSNAMVKQWESKFKK